MKKTFLFITITTVLMLSYNCNNTNTEDSGSAVAGKQEIQIKINGSLLSLSIPDTVKNKLSVVEQSWGATEVKSGKDFQISISEGEGDIALKKSDIAANDVNKFKRYLKDEQGLLFWESQITEPEFHFYCVQKVGAVSYSVEDIKGELFSEQAVNDMIEAVKSLKAATPKQNP